METEKSTNKAVLQNGGSTAVPIETQMVDKFLKSLKVHRNKKPASQATLDAYRVDLSKFGLYLLSFEKTLLEADNADIKGFLMELESSGSMPATLDRSLSSIRRFYSYLIKAHIISKNPTNDIALPKIQATQNSFLSTENVLRLVNAPEMDTPIEHRNFIMLQLLYATGMKVSELIGIKLVDIDLFQGALCIHGAQGRDRHILLTDEMVELVREYISTSRNDFLMNQESEYLLPTMRGPSITRQSVYIILKKYAKELGIDKDEVCPHALRHAFAVTERQYGTKIDKLSELLGHSDSATTNRLYGHVTKEFAGPRPSGITTKAKPILSANSIGNLM